MKTLTAALLAITILVGGAVSVSADEYDYDFAFEATLGPPATAPVQDDSDMVQPPMTEPPTTEPSPEPSPEFDPNMLVEACSIGSKFATITIHTRGLKLYGYDYRATMMSRDGIPNRYSRVNWHGDFTTGWTDNARVGDTAVVYWTVSNVWHLETGDRYSDLSGTTRGTVQGQC